jgi:hypothetical protein
LFWSSNSSQLSPQSENVRLCKVEMSGFMGGRGRLGNGALAWNQRERK